MDTTRELPAKSTAAIENVYRAEYARIFASLVRVLGSFDDAEDALQQAFIAATESWEEHGIPQKPGAWIATAARNAAVSARRHDAVVLREQSAVEHFLSQPRDEPDDRLRLIFTCCHPAIASEASIALALRTVCGLTTPAIARLLLVPEATLAQRLVRAKRKIREAHIPYVVPDAEHLDARIEAVLHVVYLMFTEGYAPAEGELVVNVPLCEEAIRLGRLLVQLLPTDGETRGLFALMILHHARRAARVGEDGEMIPLDAQDRSKWDRAAIDEGIRELGDALRRAATGPYRIEAAIAALHAEAPSTEATDWREIASLYQELYARAPSGPAAVNWSLALGRALGPEQGLAKLDRFAEDGTTLSGSDRLHAARSDLLRRAGHVDPARAEYECAMRSARNARERRFFAACASNLRDRSEASRAGTTVHLMIRRYEDRDRDAVLSLVETTLREFGFSAFVGGARTDLENVATNYGGQRAGFWVAEEDGKILGTIAIRPKDETRCELKRLYVSENARGRGIGAELYAHAESFARGAGYEKIWLDSSRKFAAARRLYEKNGFVLLDELANEWCDNVYEKDLRG